MAVFQLHQLHLPAARAAQRRDPISQPPAARQARWAAVTEATEHLLALPILMLAQAVVAAGPASQVRAAQAAQAATKEQVVEAEAQVLTASIPAQVVTARRAS